MCRSATLLGWSLLWAGALHCCHGPKPGAGFVVAVAACCGRRPPLVVLEAAERVVDGPPAHHRPKVAAAGPRAASTEVVRARPGQGFGVGPKLCRSLLRSLKSRRRLSRRLRAEGATRRPRVWRAKTDALRLEFATYTKIDKNCCSPSAQADAWVRRRRLFPQ